MTGAFRYRSIYVQLVVGSLSILIPVIALWLLVESHYLHAADEATTRRATSRGVRLNLAEARQFEDVREMGALGPYQQKFYETGDAPPLAMHREQMATLFRTVDTLATMSDADQKAADVRLRTAITAYDQDYTNLQHAYQLRGAASWGIDGQWRSALDQLLVLARGAGGAPQTDALHLIAAQRDYILNDTPGNQAAVVAASATLAQDGRGVRGLSDALARSDSLFGRDIGIRDEIGRTPDTGLQGKMNADAQTALAATDSILAQATAAAKSARNRLAVATPAGAIIALMLAGLFLYLTGISLAKTIAQMADVVEQIGQGQFNVRVDADRDDELGRLAKGMNQMAENLAELITSVQKSGIQMNTSVVEIAATSRQQQATAGEVAATTIEVGVTAREISATSRELSTRVQQLAGVAERTAGLAGSGQDGIVRMKSVMRQVADASESISARLATLSERAGNINTVVTMITKVADQTNLLSLNAAIEAEKAGEYGRGFAVVAAEIRRLANQTALATGDIERIVKDMQTAVTAGVMGMDKFSDEVSRGVTASTEVGAQLSEIIDQVQSLTPNFDMVSTGMHAQAEGAQQISDALAQLAASAQQTAESLGQSNKAIEQLNDASRGLQAGVMRFTVAG